jgi:glucose-1-phosphate thymidylyltransferase
MAEQFAGGQPVVVMLGDNIVEESIKPYVKRFAAQGRGAKILLKDVDDPWRFGVAQLEGDRIVGIEEKPQQPKSSHVVTGIYMYDARVFDIIKTLRPSSRGELEITDVNNAYIQQGLMSFDILRGWWTDAGLPETLYRATSLVRERMLRHGVGSAEEKALARP